MTSVCIGAVSVAAVSGMRALVALAVGSPLRGERKAAVLVELLLRDGQPIYVNPECIAHVTDAGPEQETDDHSPVTEIWFEGESTGWLVRGTSTVVAATLQRTYQNAFQTLDM